VQTVIITLIYVAPQCSPLDQTISMTTEKG